MFIVIFQYPKSLGIPIRHVKTRNVKIRGRYKCDNFHIFNSVYRRNVQNVDRGNFVIRMTRYTKNVSRGSDGRGKCRQIQNQRPTSHECSIFSTAIFSSDHFGCSDISTDSIRIYHPRRVSCSPGEMTKW